jgi:deazaflavin-dependent oxidoreductase (nitroreductase family)
MSNKVTRVPRPKGLMRFFARLPIFLYDAGLGRLFGSRFLVLTHTGRKSGLPRKVALEVVRHDEESDTYFVASGWGEESDWYRNVVKNPQVVIHAGSRRLAGHAERLPSERAEEEILTYARRYPTAIKSLAGIMGYEVDGTDEGYRALGRQLPIIALRPDAVSE